MPPSALRPLGDRDTYREPGAEADGQVPDGDESHAEKDAEGEAPEGAAASHPARSMQKLFWQVVHEEQDKIRQSQPELGKKEVLKMAKAACLGVPLCSVLVFN